jgi:sterol desaturase/sphingolipid hydroxylase (fatty acid hydroxylase superfamily)
MNKIDPVWKLFISYLLILLLTICSASAQIVVTEFNAAWNAANGVDWLEKLSDCDLTKVDITKETALQQKHKIVIVPTIIIFKDGEEIERFQADLSFKMLATRKELQNVINEQIMSDF